MLVCVPAKVPSRRESESGPPSPFRELLGETERSTPREGLVTIPANLVAQEETPQDTAIVPKSFELSLVPGVQLRDVDSAIRILRLGIYNKNVSVQGLDIGLINQTTEVHP